MVESDLNICKKWTDKKKKLSFYAVDVLLALAGLISIISGVWLYREKNQFIELTPSYYSALSAAGLCVFGGVTILIISLVGYFGVSTKNKHLLYLYIGFVSLLIVVHSVARITGFFHRDEAKENLRASLLRNVNETVVVTGIGREIHLTHTWDNLQRTLECCGVDSYKDWYYSVQWPKNQFVPDSCCDTYKFLHEPSMHCGKVPDDSLFLWQEGCFEKFSEWLSHHIILVNHVSTILIITEVTALISAIIITIVIRRGSYTRASRHPAEEPVDSYRLHSMDRVADANEETECEMTDLTSCNSR